MKGLSRDLSDLAFREGHVRFTEYPLYVLQSKTNKDILDFSTGNRSFPNVVTL